MMYFFPMRTAQATCFNSGRRIDVGRLLAVVAELLVEGKFALELALSQSKNACGGGIHPDCGALTPCRALDLGVASQGQTFHLTTQFPSRTLGEE